MTLLIHYHEAAQALRAMEGTKYEIAAYDRGAAGDAQYRQKLVAALETFSLMLKKCQSQIDQANNAHE